MTRIELTGLIGSHPLGALASFGLLRIRSAVDSTARLSFVERDDFVAQLDSSLESRNSLIEWLADWSRARKPSVLELLEDDVRIKPEDYQSRIAKALEPGADEELVLFLVALAAAGAEDQSKGLIKPTPFYMASGQQSFLETMRRMREHVKSVESWNEALFGPWKYQAEEWGAGWDPGTERTHALRFKAPTKDKTSCVAAAVWMGFEALPLFPAFARRGLAVATGWTERDRLDHWRWPVPTHPISVDALKVLLSSAEMHELDKHKKLRRREGIAAIYESTRHEFGQGYGVFRPARRLA